MTSEQIRTKIEEYRLNPARFIEENLKIRRKTDKVLVPFELNAAQSYAWHDVIQPIRARKMPVRIMTLKARQLGMSSLFLALQLSQCVTMPGAECITISYKKDSSAEGLISRVRQHYQQLPEWLRPMRKYETKFYLEFGNPRDRDSDINPGLGSKIFIESADNPNAGRSFALTFAHLSEFAFFENPEDTLTSVVQALDNKSAQSYGIIETTANGAGGFFYEMWQDAIQDPLRGWYPLFIPFWVNPDYSDVVDSEMEEQDIYSSMSPEELRMVTDYDVTPGQVKWMRRIIRENFQGRSEKFYQEYAPNAEDCFLLQGDTVFSKQRIRQYQENIVSRYPGGMQCRIEEDSLNKPNVIKDSSGTIILWEKPVDSTTYVIGVDCCSGQGQVIQELLSNEEKVKAKVRVDYSAIQVLAIVGNDQYRQVAEMRSYIAHEDLAKQAMLLGRLYNTATIMVESNTVGQSVIHKLRFNYPKLGYWERVDKRVPKGLSQYLGWDSNKRSLQYLKNELISTINEGRIVIRSKTLVKEMTSYVYRKDGKGIEASAGAHDDLLMALGLAIVAAKQTSCGTMPVRYYEDGSNAIWTKSGVVVPSFSRREEKGDYNWMTL